MTEGRLATLHSFDICIAADVRYGIYAYYYFPPSQIVLKLCQPLLALTGAVPFGHMIPWFAIYLGGVFNSLGLSRPTQ